MMCDENNYAESPYVASRTALLARQKRQPEPPMLGLSSTSGTSAAVCGNGTTSHQHSIHTSFQKQNQQQNHHQQQHHQQQANHQQQFMSNNQTNNGNHFHSSPASQQQSSQQQQQSFHQQQNQQIQLLNSNLQSSIEITNQLSSNQLDKENRQFSDILHGKFPIPNSAKSNAIFDRFDIMNSEKPHRFKVI
jgi:hypothetical protein